MAETGMLSFWPTGTAPTGWVFCYGQVLDASADSSLQALYDVIGNAFGGSDNSDFQTPDLRGRMILGQDDMGGTSANRVTATEADSIGSVNGAEDHALDSGENGSHSHSGAFVTSNGWVGVGGDYTNNNTNQVFSSVGSGDAHNNMPPYLTMAVIIKL